MNGDNSKNKIDKFISIFIEQKLPGRIQEIIDQIREVLRAGFKGVCLESIIRSIHNLKGTVGTYGLPDIAELLEKIEDYYKVIQETDDICMDEEKERMHVFIQELVLTIDDPRGKNFADLMPLEPEAGSFEKWSTADNARNDGIQPGKIVFLIEPDDSVSNDLIRQFALYGYDTETVRNISEIIKYIHTRRDEVIVIIDTLFLENEHLDFSRLAVLKEEKRDLVLAFVSRHGDFELRLKAVKAGADAYFVLPLDVGESIDKLNSLTTRNNPYHVLIVDDDPHLVAYYAHLLQQRNMITSVVSKPMEVVSQIIMTKPELILMDLNMPNCNGWELAKIIRQQEAFVSIPIVFLSSEKNIEKQYEALRNGGDDFISKKTPPRELIESIRIRAERYRSLRFYMERDSLTGLLNHTRLIEQLVAEINKAKRMRQALSFAMLDLDHFKAVNDTHGHIIGDKVLKRLSRLLKERLRNSDIIGRYGGEEFAIILPNTNGKQAQLVLDEIRVKFSQMSHTGPNDSFIVTLSVGIASYFHGENCLSIIEVSERVKELATRITNAADKALYEAKGTGRNRIVKVCISESQAVV